MHLPRASTAIETAHSIRLNHLVVESTITAALGGLLFGFDTAVIAGVTSSPKPKGFTLEELQKQLETS